MKKALLIFGVLCALGVLAIGHQYAQNGRYQVPENGRRLLDTRTGATYRLNGPGVPITPLSPPVE